MRMLAVQSFVASLHQSFAYIEFAAQDVGAALESLPDAGAIVHCIGFKKLSERTNSAPMKGNEFLLPLSIGYAIVFIR